MILKKDQLLSTKTLSTLPMVAKNNAPLGYNREAVKPGVLHFSVGNFQRAHQASYFNDMLAKLDNDNNDLKWGIVGASVRQGGSYTEETRPALKKQDYLYTLVQSDDKEMKPQVIGSIVDCLPVTDDHEPIKKALMDENIKIASMTVTEGGYFVDPATNEFDPTGEDIQHDIQNPDDPQTVFGLLVQGLRHRRDKGMKPFTIMSCDNVPQNGEVARSAVLGLANRIDKKLASWIDENVSFPSSMVDRITPTTTDDLLSAVDLEYEDLDPIFCEPFRQWVIEDDFCNERPPLEEVGVRFVKDVTPWENAKLRILNGGHASMSYPAALLGIEYVHGAMQHPIIPQFLDKLQMEEIVPHVPPVPDTDLNEYWDEIRGRYENSRLSDSIDRNCDSGSDRQPKFILPSIVDGLKKDKSVDGLATVSAMWCKYCSGKTESGEDIEIQDDLKDKLVEAAAKAKEDPSAWLALDGVYGDVGRDEKFQQAFSKALRLCIDDGVEAAMKKYIES